MKSEASLILEDVAGNDRKQPPSEAIYWSSCFWNEHLWGRSMFILIVAAEMLLSSLLMHITHRSLCLYWVQEDLDSVRKTVGTCDVDWNRCSTGPRGILWGFSTSTWPQARGTVLRAVCSRSWEVRPVSCMLDSNRTTTTIIIFWGRI